MFLLSSQKTLYRSVDGGKTWADQMEAIRHLHSHKFADHLPVGTTLRGVTSITKSEHLLVFLGEDGLHVASKDAGKTYFPIWHPEKLAEFKLHPTHPNMLLASTLTPRCYTAEEEGLCYKNLLFSSDHGDTWRLLQEYVVQFDWVRHMKTHGHEYPEDAIFATVHAEEHRGRGHQTFGKWDNRVDFVLTRDLFLSHTVLVPRGNRFLFTERYVAVAAVGDRDKHVNLVLSSDGGHRWHTAELEYPMTQHSYTILDTSNDAVFLHVNHAGEGARWGNVYLSNSIGTNFSLSLPHNRRDENGKCDFEKLQSMEGVYIANYYENVGELTAYEHAAGEAMGQSIAGKTDGGDLADLSGLTPPDPQIRTVMTFDRGASWEYLPAPKYDALAQAVECHSGDHPMDGVGARHCSLHLHGVTDVFGPFYSSPNAVGLMMATGNIGSELTFREGLVNTYFSRDGGHEWFEVAKGSHIYEFGDHGGIIVMANDEAEVTEVMYSWNEGLTWEALKFATSPVLVDNIMIEPKGAAERFVLYGTRADPSAPESGLRVGVVFTLDFTQLHMRQCTGEDSAGTEASDFERWAPSATSKGDSCLMGRRVEYTRRKRDRACYNPDAIEIVHFVANCECSDRDWECDRGYRRVPIDGPTCVRDPEVPIDVSHLVPHYCRPGLHYHVSNGYRKVAGDSCIGGVHHEMSMLPCPGSAWHHSVSHGGWTAMLLLVGLAIALAGVTYCQLSVRRGGPGGSGSGLRKGGAAGALSFAFLPPVIGKPIALLVGVVVGVMHFVASGLYHGVMAVVGLVRRSPSGPGSNIGSAGTGGSGYSSRGLGIPATSGSGAAFTGVSYNQMGKEAVDSAADGEDDEETGSGSHGARLGGGRAGHDDDFGLSGDEEDAQVLSGSAIAKAVSGSGSGEGDLLGLSDPLGAVPGLAAAGSGNSGTPAAKVPTLRPPRSHDGKKA